MKKTLLVLTTAVVLFTAGCSAQITTKTTPNADGSTPAVNVEITTPQVTVTTPATTPTTPADTKVTYNNSQYGFSLELPATWKDYKVTERVGTGNNLVTFDFQLKNESLFAVSVYTKTEFAKITEDSDPIVFNTKIAESSLYVFTAVGSQDNSASLSARRQEVKGILGTFKAY
jgi:hypothetical protein